MACPAIPPIPIWLNVLAVPASAAGAAATFASVSGVVKAIGFTSSAATAQLRGTDIRPIDSASRMPAAIAVAAPWLGLRMVAGKSFEGTPSLLMEGSSPFQPLTISSVCWPVSESTMEKGMSTGPAAMSCGITAAKSVKSDGNEMKIEIKSLKVLNGSVAADPVAADWDVARPCRACGTAEKACCAEETALCASPAVVLAA